MCIPETPIAHPNSESLQESKDTNSPRSMEVLQHVLQGHQQSQIHGSSSRCTTKGTGHQG